MLRRTRVGAYAIVTARGALLLTQLGAGPDRGRWSLPGGGLEHGEHPREALARELEEEAGLALEAPSLSGLISIREPHLPTSGPPEDVHYLGIIFHAALPAQTPLKEQGDGEGCTAARWFELSSLEQVPLSRSAREALTHAGLLSAD